MSARDDRFGAGRRGRKRIRKHAIIRQDHGAFNQVLEFPHISGAMLADKLTAIRESGAEVLVSNDCGCLMQIGGGLRRARANIEVRHLAEVLASR